MIEKAHLGVPQQLHNSSLIGRESSNLPDNRAHELGALGGDTLALTGADSLGDRSGREALVETNTEIYRKHADIVSAEVHGKSEQIDALERAIFS